MVKEELKKFEKRRGKKPSRHTPSEKNGPTFCAPLSFPTHTVEQAAVVSCEGGGISELPGAPKVIYPSFENPF